MIEPLFIFNFNKYKNILIFVLIFSAIFLGIVGLFEVVLYYFGETISYAKVIDLQKENNSLYGTKYFNTTDEYKIVGIKEYKPNLLIMGSSRVMQIRQKHFSDKYRVYNMGTMASFVGGFAQQLKIIKDINMQEMPKIIIYGIDPWLFNPAYNQQGRMVKLGKYLEKFKMGAVLKFAYRLWKEAERRLQAYRLFIKEKDNKLTYLIRKKYDNKLGLNAIIFGAGFRKDGSYQYPLNHQYEKVTVEENKRRLMADQYRFQSAISLEPTVITEFKEFLAFLKVKDIIFIGILLPFEPNFLEAMTTLESHAIFFNNFEREVSRVIQEYNYRCYNYSSIVDLVGNKDYFFLDAIHPGEDLMGEIIKHIDIDNK